MIKSAHINILETSTVSLEAGTEDAAHPLYRLYDRNIGRPFKTTAAGTLEVKIDQGAAGGLAVDRLLIPAGHSLDGMTLDIKYSDDDLAYTPAVAQWTGAEGLINRSWNALAKRYWKFVVTSPASVPEITELFLTSTYAWQRDPARPAGRLDRVFNVENAVTSAGQDRFLVHGEPRRRRSYALPRVGEAQKDSLLALNEAWAGSKPFWLSDHEGSWIYGKLAGPMELTETAYQSYGARFEFHEVLP